MKKTRKEGGGCREEGRKWGEKNDGWKVCRMKGKKEERVEETMQAMKERRKQRLKK